MNLQEESIIIGIEAAISGGSLSFYRSGKEFAAYIGQKGVSRAEDLLPTIDHLLRKNKLSRDHIGRVVVSTGPGSFTGIKIGIATAMGLADGLRRPLVGISATAALTFAAGSDTNVLTAVPVGRDLICVQHFSRSDYKLKPNSRPQVLSEVGFSKELANKVGTAVLYEQLCQRFNLAEADGVVSSGSNIATLLIRGDLDGHSSEDFVPIFVDRDPTTGAG